MVAQLNKFDKGGWRFLNLPLEIKESFQGLEIPCENPLSDSPQKFVQINYPITVIKYSHLNC